MKIQPINFNTANDLLGCEPAKPVGKSRIKRLFERQFSTVLKISFPEKPFEEPPYDKDRSEEFEPSSVCLAKMVRNFMEENERQSAVRCVRKRSNCLHGNSLDNSEDDCDSFNCFGDSNHSSAHALEILKSLVLCTSISERNLLVDTAKIVEKKKIPKRKDEYSKNVVVEGLLSLGYDVSICKSRWERSTFYPAGEYEYIDVIEEGERFIVDIDFKSEFEIARPTKSYRAVIRSLPRIFAGKTDRLQRIIDVTSKAAKQSLKKKGMPFPPWRKADYVNAKWLSPYTRAGPPLPLFSSSLNPVDTTSLMPEMEKEKKNPLSRKKSSCTGLELMFAEGSPPDEIDVADRLSSNLSKNCCEEGKNIVACAGKMAHNKH